MISLGLLLAAAQVNAAEASDGTINFDGNIADQTCSVNVNDSGSNTGTVTLPKVAAGMLSADGQTAGRTRFTIGLTGCSTKTGGVYAYFEQGANVNAEGHLKNTGTAQNVELQLLDANDVALNVGSDTQRNDPAKETMSGGTATLTYSAQYYATAAATSGTVASSVTYSINYL